MQTEVSTIPTTNEEAKKLRRRTLSLSDSQKQFHNPNNTGGNQLNPMNKRKSRSGFAYMPSEMPIVIKDKTYIDRKDTLNTFLKKKDFNFVLGIPETLTMKTVSLSRHVSLEQVQNVSKVNKDKMIRINNQKTGVMYTNELWSQKYYLQMIKKTGMRNNFDRVKLKDELQSAELRYQQLDNIFKKKREKDVGEQELNKLLSKYQSDPLLKLDHKEEQPQKQKDNPVKNPCVLFNVVEEPKSIAELGKSPVALTHRPPIHRKSPSNPLISPKILQTTKGFSQQTILNSPKEPQLMITTQAPSVNMVFEQQSPKRPGRNSSLPNIKVSVPQFSKEQPRQLSPKLSNSPLSPKSLHQNLIMNLQTAREKK